MKRNRSFRMLVAGAGAIGSRFEAAAFDRTADVVFADRDRVTPENIGPAAFGGADVGAEKAALLARRWRSRGGSARALPGDLRYTLRPGLAAQLHAVVLCLDNPTAIRDAVEAVWAGGPVGLPVFVVTCGGERGEYQIRVFLRPGPCPVCLFGEELHRADRRALGTSCADTSAPRAAAAAAEAAARAAADILARWRRGDHSLANCRAQSDGNGEPFLIRMPGEASPRCPVPHRGIRELAPLVELSGSIAELEVGALAERAAARVGADAQIDLGRRAAPLHDLYCTECRKISPAPPLLMPAAQALDGSCNCGAPLRPLGDRHSIPVQELEHPSVASLSLAAWGAGHGDEFLVHGKLESARLRCTFQWSDLDDD